MALTLTQFDLVEVEWLDAALGYNWQGPVDQAGQLATMSRVGYFLGRRKHTSGMKYLVFASERCEGDEVREPMAIPEQWITGLRKLQPGKSYGKDGKRRKKR